MSIFSANNTSLHGSQSFFVGQRRRAFAVTTVVVVSLLVACAGMSPQRIALNSLQGIRDAVVTSTKVFNVGYQAGQFNELQRTQLSVLYGKYLAADKIAAETLGATTAGGDPSAIVAQVTLVAADVIKFVQSLKGKVP